MIVKVDSFLISLDSFYEPFAYGNIFSASVFIGIEPISCDVEKWPLWLKKIPGKRAQTQLLLNYYVSLVWSKEIINFDFVLNKREKSGSGYITWTTWGARLRTHVTHAPSPVPLCSAIPSCVPQALASGLGPETLRWLASCKHHHLRTPPQLSWVDAISIFFRIGLFWW